MGVAAIVISALALVVSGLAYWRQVRWARVAADAQNRLAAIEQERRDHETSEMGRAVLTARFVRIGKSAQLLIANQGRATARNLTVKVNASAGTTGKPPIIHAEFPHSLSARGEASVMVLMHANVASTCDVTFSWSDDEGDHTDNIQVPTR